MKLKLFVGLAVFVIATPVGLAAAQTVETDPSLVQQVPTIPPTVPCEGCGPGTGVGDGTHIWGYAEHHCPPGTLAATYSLTYGVGRLYPNPVQFYARTGEQTGFPVALPDIPLRLVQPGQSFTDYPVLTVPPGASVEVTAFGVDTVTGLNPAFYNGETIRTRILQCPCEIEVPTPTPSVTPGTPAPTTPPATGTAISVGRPRVAPKKLTSGSTTTTTTGTLPATGSTSDTVVLLAVALLGLGGFFKMLTWQPLRA